MMKNDKKNKFTEKALDSALNRERAQTSSGFTAKVMNMVSEKRREADLPNTYPTYFRRLSWAAVAAGFMLIINVSFIGFITSNSTAEQEPKEISEALYHYLDLGNETQIDWTELAND